MKSILVIEAALHPAHWFGSRVDTLRSAAALLLVLLIAAACAPNEPPATKDDALRRGDELFAAGNYDRAVRAYREAVDIDPRDGLPRMKLATAYEHAGNWEGASAQAIRAADLLPGNYDATLMAARLILNQGRYEDAAKMSGDLLKERPDDTQALVLSGTARAQLLNSSWALFKLGDTGGLGDEYRNRLQELRPLVSAEDDRAAEAALRKAVELAPKSVDIRMALVNFLWATNRPEQSEALLKSLADELPGHASFNHSLGAYYLARRRAAEGEHYLKNATLGAAPYNQPPALALVDHYERSGRLNDALAILLKLASEDQKLSIVPLKIADFEIRLARYEDASHQIDEFLKRNPRNALALSLRARALVAMGKTAEGLTAARAAVATDPKLGEARMALGQALSAAGDAENAFNEYSEALRRDPTATQLASVLARLGLETGRDRVALVYARQAVSQYPAAPEAKIAVLTALVRLRDYKAADTALQPLLALRPMPADVQVQLGLLHAARGNAATARAAFERALRLDPEGLDALVGLVSLEINSGQTTSARKRVDQAMSKHPNSAGFLRLASTVFRAEGDNRRAEVTLRRALDLEPGNVSTALLLVECLVDQRRQEDAKHLLEQVLEHQPSSVAAQTSFAILLEHMGRPDEAQVKYEKIIADDPGASTAAAHLGLLYVNRGQNLDLALSFLAKAKQLSPNDPDVSDALGWVYLQKNVPGLALPQLEDATRTNPKSAVFQYHVGAAYAQAGQTRKAREALTRALALDNGFADRAKAQATLDALPK